MPPLCDCSHWGGGFIQAVSFVWPPLGGVVGVLMSGPWGPAEFQPPADTEPNAREWKPNAHHSWSVMILLTPPIDQSDCQLCLCLKLVLNHD